MKNLLRSLFGSRRRNPHSKPSRRIAAKPSRLWLEELEGRMVLNSHPAGEVAHHLHAHVQIFINGQNFVIPPGVNFPQTHAPDFPNVPSTVALGVNGTDENAHTHTDDGILHLDESTSGALVFVKLNEFFTNWGGIFSSTELKLPTAYGSDGHPTAFSDNLVDATHTIKFFVNGAASTDFQNYEPEDGDQIIISYETIPGATAPRLNPINNVTMPSNPGANAPARTYYVPLDGSDPAASALTYTATVSPNSSQLSVQVIPPTSSAGTNPTLRLNVSGKDIDGNNFTGDLTFELFHDIAPATVDRIMTLVNQGFYTNLTFHRIVNDFVAQGGDPNGNGSGGSGTTFADEFSTQATFDGSAQLAMANSGDDTNDSQFFVTDSNLSLVFNNSSQNEDPPAFLNFNHTIFGQLISGFDTFNKLMLTPVHSASATSEKSIPNNPVTINTATIVTDNQHALLKLTVPHDFTATDINTAPVVTVTATNASNLTARRSFVVSAVSDATNDRAFLGTIPPQATTVNTPVTFTLPATDLEGDTLTYEAGNPSDPTTPPANATVSIDQSTGAVTVTPANNFQGTLTLKVGVRDQTHRASQTSFTQADFDTQTITIPVAINNAPTANNQNVNAGFGASKVITLTGDDGDSPAVQTLTFRVQILPQHGTLKDSNGNFIVNVGTALPSATVTYTPTGGFSGADDFQFDVKDSGGTAGGGHDTSVNTATVSITVSPNQAPIATPQTVGTTLNTAKSITLTGDDGDPGITQTLTFRVRTLPTNGTLTDSNSHVIVAGDLGANGYTLPTATVTYTPTAGTAGSDHFTFDVKDDGGTTNGGQDTSAAATVTINVTPNQKPTADVQTVATQEGVAKTITLAGDDGDATLTQTLTFRIRTLPTDGTLTDSNSHVIVAGDLGATGFALASPTLTYTPNAGVTGTDTFTFDVKDNGGTSGGGVDTSDPATVTVNVMTASQTNAGAGAELRNGELAINGDKNDNTIDVSLNTAGDMIDVTIDGNVKSFALADVHMIQLHGHGGNDDITVAADITVPAHILGGKGDDTITAGGGDSTIRGGRGNDDITGGDGNDKIFGRQGDDTIDAGNGNNEVHGGKGNDSITGGDGNDLIFGGRGDDTVDGGAGNDTIHGRAGNDSLLGGTGDDQIFAGLGDDSLNGGDGHDSLHGGQGTDTNLVPDANDKVFDIP